MKRARVSFSFGLRRLGLISNFSTIMFFLCEIFCMLRIERNKILPACQQFSVKFFSWFFRKNSFHQIWFNLIFRDELSLRYLQVSPQNQLWDRYSSKENDIANEFTNWFYLLEEGDKENCFSKLCTRSRIWSNDS